MSKSAPTLILQAIDEAVQKETRSWDYTKDTQ
jgi:hypothetical protein